MNNFINPNVNVTKDGVIICNKRAEITPVNWDELANEQISKGIGFRITQEGKTDANNEPGLYSIHSPLYGTDYGDENSFEDRYSCKCGYYQGKHHMDEHSICPKCKTMVKFVDIDMRKTGWIILDRDYIIHAGIFKKLWNFIGKNRFPDIIEFRDPSKRVPTNDNPFQGIGMIEFRERVFEILEFFLRKFPNKIDQYNWLIENKDCIFARSIPVYNMHLRQFVVREKEIKYSDEDVLFRRIFTDHRLLNDRFELQRRRTVRANRERRRVARGEEPHPVTVDYLRRENILYSIEMSLNKLWELSFGAIDKKSGIIRDQISGGRQNYTARNVIVPAVDMLQDGIGIGYITFLELFKLEIIKNLIDQYDLDFNSANDMWTDATFSFNENVYNIMKYMISVRPMYVSIGRNPSINFGSIMGMRIARVNPDITDYCMEIPILILSKPNADFDGDVMNLIGHPVYVFAQRYYEDMNPLDNMIISHNDGLFDKDANLRKDLAIEIYAFATV